MGFSLLNRDQRYSPSAGLPFDDDELESRLVWIWTSARSGSTWFLRLLAHPLRLGPGGNEDDVLGYHAPRDWRGTVDTIPVDTTFVANHLAPLIREEAYDEQCRPVTFASFPGMVDKPSYFFSRRYERAWRPELRRLMLVRFQGFVDLSAERYEVSDPLILLKEVAGGHAAELVMSLFPRSRMIFLIRDGRDVVDSQVQANQPGGWMPLEAAYESDQERLEFLRQRCRQWVGETSAIQRALESHPAELQRTVRYEDLLADTTGVLGPLVEWLGLRRGSRWVQRAVESNAFEKVPEASKGPAKFYRAATPGYWRQSLSADEQRLAHEIMGAKLAELGYADVTAR